MVLGIIVLTATLTVLDSARGVINRDDTRATSAQNPLPGAARMVRELRATEEVVDMGPNFIDVIVSVRDQLSRVRFDCDVASTNSPTNPYDDTYRRCVRRSADAVPNADPPALPDISQGVVMVDRICPGTGATTCDTAASSPVFTCRGDDGAVVTCAQLPLPPVDPDDLPEADDEPPAPRWPASIDVSIAVPARGGTSNGRYSHRITFNDGVYLRNVNRDQDAGT